jgi:uroporphyrin-III C-methyltransferase
MYKSTLFLVGAGPGDPELITLKAIRVLRQADVVLYDALVNVELLSYLKPNAIKRFVGKRYRRHALTQNEINDLIISYGSRYQKIVRLKGGDPFVFGRAQEEMESAAAAGMKIEIIPGISSALAVPALQQIPLTCRGFQESFWVVTGTTRSGAISEDLKLAAQSSATIILLMAMSRLEQIMDTFLSYGKGATPVAIIQEGSTPNEKKVTGTVKDIAFKAQIAGLSNPAIIIVGDVVDLPNRLSGIKRSFPPKSQTPATTQ